MKEGNQEMKTKAMKRTVTLMLLLALGGVPALAEENEQIDHELPLIKDGVLGTVNVLREMDVKTGKNLVTVKGAAEFSHDWNGGPAESTIDGGAVSYRQAKNTEPWVVTYALPALRTVSSIAIEYMGRTEPPDTVRLEGSVDGGKTWFNVFKSRPPKTDFFLKCFKPAKVNALRLTQEGKDPRTTEVFVYADPEVPLPLFGGKDSSAFSFLRNLWYRGKIKLIKSPSNGAWAEHSGGMPHVPFMSKVPGYHAAMCFGEGNKGGGNRLYLRLDLDKAYPMNFGLIGCPNAGEGTRPKQNLAEMCRAEFYTANGNLDPSTLKGNSIQDLTGQGWVLQKAWDKDQAVSKDFLLQKPGKFNQILIVWDLGAYSVMDNLWSHLEMFGAEAQEAGGASKNEQK
jgi:hypothetical protein